MVALMIYIQDTQEFLRCLLDCLHESLKQEYFPPDTESAGLKKDTEGILLEKETDNSICLSEAAEAAHGSEDGVLNGEKENGVQSKLSTPERHGRKGIVSPSTKRKRAS